MSIFQRSTNDKKVKSGRAAAKVSPWARQKMSQKFTDYSTELRAAQREQDRRESFGR